jgi:hypothetical protein
MLRCKIQLRTVRILNNEASREVIMCHVHVVTYYHIHNNQTIPRLFGARLCGQVEASRLLPFTQARVLYFVLLEHIVRVALLFLCMGQRLACTYKVS